MNDLDKRKEESIRAVSLAGLPPDMAMVYVSKIESAKTTNDLKTTLALVEEETGAARAKQLEAAVPTTPWWER